MMNTASLQLINRAEQSDRISGLNQHKDIGGVHHLAE